MPHIAEIMQTSPVIPVIVIDEVDHAAPLAEALVAGGLRVLEVTLRTPAAILARLQGAVAKAVAGPELRERMATLGADPVADTPEHFAAFTRSEYDRWGKLVREANITVD